MKRANLIASFAVLASAVAVPSVAMAQTAPEEIVVTGNYGTVPDSVRSLSQSVSYSDLDLSTKPGRDEMRRRLNLTARFLCDKLGEGNSSSGPIPSCRETAVKDAMARLGTVEQSFGPRGTTWVSPPAWTPPYAPEWAKQYP